MHIRFPRIRNRIPFLFVGKNEIEIGYGAHAITFGRYAEGCGLFITWM